MSKWRDDAMHNDQRMQKPELCDLRDDAPQLFFFFFSEMRQTARTLSKFVHSPVLSFELRFLTSSLFPNEQKKHFFKQRKAACQRHCLPLRACDTKLDALKHTICNPISILLFIYKKIE